MEEVSATADSCENDQPGAPRKLTEGPNCGASVKHSCHLGYIEESGRDPLNGSEARAPV